MQSRNELLYKLETSINKLRKFCCPDFDEINSREYYKEIIEKAEQAKKEEEER